MPLRALCATLNGDVNATNLIAEQIAATDEGFGVWLLAAAGAIAAPESKKPDGRYATPFEAAVSVAAKLSAPANALNGMPGRHRRRHRAQSQRDPGTAPRRTSPSARFSGRIKSADVLAILTAEETRRPRPSLPARAQRTASGLCSPHALAVVRQC